MFLANCHPFLQVYTPTFLQNIDHSGRARIEVAELVRIMHADQPLCLSGTYSSASIACVAFV
jgi:hypothetical protein